jgi:hypothetical protein
VKTAGGLVLGFLLGLAVRWYDLVALWAWAGTP